jgi:hypothetical protein
MKEEEEDEEGRKLGSSPAICRVGVDAIRIASVVVPRRRVSVSFVDAIAATG